MLGPGRFILVESVGTTTYRRLLWSSAYEAELYGMYAWDKVRLEIGNPQSFLNAP